MKKIFLQLLRDSRAAFLHPYSLRVSSLYVWFTIKNVIFVKLLRMKPRRQRMLGYTVRFGSYGSFYALFTEIFVHRIYDVKLRKRATIIDAGANIGMATLYCKWQYPDAKILCFEPDPGAFQMLQKNVGALKGVKCYQLALGKSNGHISLYQISSFTGGTGGTVQEFRKTMSKDRVVRVELSRLSTLLTDKDEIDLLKIDVEGSEQGILEDLEKTGRLSQVKKIIFEFHYTYGVNTRTNCWSRVTKILEESGFVFTINADPLIDTVTQVKNRDGILQYESIVRAFRP